MVTTSSTTKDDKRDALLETAEQTISSSFHTPDGTPFVTIWREDHLENWPVCSQYFRDWLQFSHFKRHKSAVSPSILDEVVPRIESQARYEGEEQEISLRVAELNRAMYIDLCDSKWRAVEITATGWSIDQFPPVKFVRRVGMRPLPEPVRGGHLRELRRFVNLKTDEDWLLYLCYVLAALRPRGPYPILSLYGEQGTAKTTATKITQKLIDPSEFDPRTPPANPHDFMIAAKESHLLAYDNLSGILPWLSDALCRISTGAASGIRKYYTDDEQRLFKAKRPVIFNGIVPLGYRPDLLERIITLDVPEIQPGSRKTEEQFWTEFDAAWPRIFGALLDAASAALRELPNVRLGELPRLADFAKWSTAAEQALGFRTGDFMRAFNRKRADASSRALEASLAASAVVRLMDGKADWQGTHEELLNELNARERDNITRQAAWPKTPEKLAAELDRFAKDLRQVAGINRIKLQRSGQRRPIMLTKSPVPDSE